jgi:trehalose 6-phosphate synthase/phosphatase
MQEHPRTRQRLVIVSNRLPFSVAGSSGTYEYRETTGGLVTGLSTYLSTVGSEPNGPSEYVWVGWPGSTIEPKGQAEITDHALKQFRSVPVFLSEGEMDKFYLGFCNKTIWPLFHSMPSPAVYDEAMWQTYKSVNEKFGDELLRILKPDDLVWIHDYHLMLLPRLLKERMATVHIGFFLHIPFPSYEIFRLLPSTWRKEILDGVLGADLVGFHTYEYTQHFLQSVLRILGYGNNIGQILLPERTVRADTFPMGIDYERFSAAASSDEVQAEVSRLRATLGDVRVVLSADRLDYTKGIPNRLLGYDLFLEQNPQWHGKIVLLLVVVPSRIGVEQYEQMKRQLEELVGRINGKYGSIGWAPVVYQYRHLPFVPLVALYATSDVSLVTPLRDGMNLVAKEYVASRTSGSGVLILSEMAGAAKELGEAVLVNPNHCGEIAAALTAALNIPKDEQARRLRIMQARLQQYTVHRWANDFVQATLGTMESKRKYETQGLSTPTRKLLLKEYRDATERLVLLDYDGTLVPFVTDPAQARPGYNVVSIVRRLTLDPANHVVVISGRDRVTLESWLGSLPIHLVAEHGFLSRQHGSEWRPTKTIAGDWKHRLLPILSLFADRLPGALVEEKEYSLVWHYRGADPEQGEVFAHELADNLNSLTGNVDVQVMQANKAIEIRVSGINKGTVAKDMIAVGAYDFILAIGDDATDEDLFAVLPEWAHSIKVGAVHSHAKYNCRDVDEVHRLLSMLGDLSPDEKVPNNVITRSLRFLERLTKRLSDKV